MYGYLRRWWVVIALGLTLGALAGLAYAYSRGGFSETYRAIAEIHLRSPMGPRDIPHIHFDILSDPSQTGEQAATENATSKVDQFVAYTNAVIVC